ncbi:prostaglandin E2 receptor EP1 subtype [Tupaia chinensis]|uniref:prostaglandin E2 receptor EP1 subtype n=1 Tax=Tupaia chinensis TaxID=246437 RepID=UPI00070459D2|nr:prostaglandin E2 receptor EP1 subtype [Tupaia chinensis]
MSLCGPFNLSLAGEATTCTAPGVLNASAAPPSGGPGGSPALPIFSMTLGAVSNVLALALLAQAAGRLRRRRSAATFLLFVARLLATPPHAPHSQQLSRQVLVVLAVGGWSSSSLQRPLFLAVRLASWNQILDPWVYILLRQAVLRQLLRLLPPRASVKGGPGGMSLTRSAWEVSSLRSSRHSGLSHF